MAQGGHGSILTTLKQGNRFQRSLNSCEFATWRVVRYLFRVWEYHGSRVRECCYNPAQTITTIARGLRRAFPDRNKPVNRNGLWGHPERNNGRFPPDRDRSVPYRILNS